MSCASAGGSPASFSPARPCGALAPESPLGKGLEATWRLAADPALDGVTGRSFDSGDEARAHAQAYDADGRRRLRELSARLVGL
jgi:hypothetical protein